METDKTKQVREYLEYQVGETMRQLKIWLDRRNEAAEKIEELRDELEKLTGVLELLRKQTGHKGQQPLFEESLMEVEKPLSELSIADASYKVLENARMPLHVTKIWEQLQRGGKTLRAKRPTLSVTASLLKDERFENLGKNTFRLREIGGEIEQTK